MFSKSCLVPETEIFAMKNLKCEEHSNVKFI